MEAPVIMKGDPVARTQKGLTKDLSKAVLKKVNQKAPSEARPIARTKKFNKRFIQGGPKKGAPKAESA